MVTSRIATLGICALLASTGAAVAADSASAGVVVGANIGSAGLSGRDATGIDAQKKGGLYIGGFVDWTVNDWLAIVPEVAYSQKHFTPKDTRSGFSSDEKWDWVEIPVVAHVSVWHAGSHSIYAAGGPFFAFRARAKEDAAGQTSDIKDLVQSTDAGVTAGAGVKFGNAAVEVVYDAGLRNLNKNFGLGDDLTVKSRALRIDFRWSFR